MQKSQVFKVKGMQRDASMPNANGEFAYEIINMRLMPAEDGAGFSLTNEKGTEPIKLNAFEGTIIGQCATLDSLIVFTTDKSSDYIYQIKKVNTEWQCELLYTGKLNFSEEYPIEALFNYETKDIQKVYWIDGINQLRCINIADTTTNYNESSFDSIKEIDSVPSVDLSLSAGGKFTAGVLQYYITYFNKFSSESPILYTSPLLHIAHEGRGGNTNDGINTAYRLKISDLDNSNWEYIRIYATHRTSLEATPEGSIIAEIKIPEDKTIDFTDYGSNRVSIDPNELHFVGGKHIVADTMTAKDQVLFLGNLKIDTNKTINYDAVNSLFADLRANGTIDNFFFTNTTKTKENKLSEYEDKYYYYKSNLNNTEPITHYKYGEKYRFGISLMDKYGNWSNPIWIKDAFITVAPEQIDGNTLALPCPQLKLSEKIPGQNKSLWDVLKDNGTISIKPLVVFPSIDERKVLAQGVVCPTVYNLKDRKENGPYAQASWFMRPNAPIDIWGTKMPSHDSDIITPGTTKGYLIFNKKSIRNKNIEGTKWLDMRMSLVYDDLSIYKFNDTVSQEDYIAAIKDWNNSASPYVLYNTDDYDVAEDLITAGSWVEFRHNYALRTKGWTWGPQSDWYDWSFGIDDNREWEHNQYPLSLKDSDISSSDTEYLWRTYTGDINGNFPKDTTGIVAVDAKDLPEDVVNLNRAIFYKFRLAASRCAELDTSRFGATIPVNRFYDKDLKRDTWREVPIVKFNTGNSAYYVDNSIVTLNSPEIEMQENMSNISLDGYDFRIVGAIPLTATISDISLETTGSIYNPSANDEISFGLKKVLVQNKNIGHHGFKGMVTHSVLYSGHNNPEDTYTFNASGSNLTKETNALYGDRYAASFPLHPWQSTGNIPGFNPSWTEKNNYSKLNRKILSNLRYSANTKYLPSAWTPSNGSTSQWYTSSDASIIKLSLEGYSDDLVYSANIDSIATATAGENNDIPIPIYQYFYGRKLVPTSEIEIAGYSPYRAGACFDDVYKTGIGSSIKYKSSPHAVIGFNNIPVTISGNKMYTQEILPTFDAVNTVGRSMDHISTNLTPETAGVLYENDSIISIPHQDVLSPETLDSFGLPGYGDLDTENKPTYGWLWLGELYKPQDPTFGGDTEYALQNNSWEVGGTTNITSERVIEEDRTVSITNVEGQFESRDDGETTNDYTIEWYDGTLTMYMDGQYHKIVIDSNSLCLGIIRYLYNDEYPSGTIIYGGIVTVYDNMGNTDKVSAKITIYKMDRDFSITVQLEEEATTGLISMSLYDISRDELFIPDAKDVLSWTIGDTYYQRFDTLKTYAYSDKDENSIVDITSFMVETRVNIDGRYDRNRGQDSNLQMSPTNFNLLNDVYSQRDNLFTYRILDKDIQSRTEFPNQITWSLSKTAGATVDAWMNHTLASVLDLDGTKGNLTALKTFGDQIISFQETGISTILFNSRVQIPTSEYVPIQIANSGKVEGQQYFTTDLGCQDKRNIVTSPQGLYFVDYYNKSIYKFNGQIEDLSTANGFRGWCDKNITSNSSIVGYYDKKNKEVMFYSPSFESINEMETQWLGFSELINVFSSFYTYPNARLVSLKDDNLWLYNQSVYSHQTGKYNNLLGKDSSYGLTAIVKNDSNITKIFNSIEFRSDLYESSDLRDFETFDTIQIEDEHNGKTSAYLDYSPYRPSNLKKRSRTWRASIPRVGNGYNRYVNQWAKVGLWMTHKYNSIAVEHSEKVILHDMAVWYTE